MCAGETIGAGDSHGAKILERILDDAIRHVAIGTQQFIAESRRRGEMPEKLWNSLVEKRFESGLQPPFNDSARLAAGLSRNFYQPLAQ
ncbi:MAG: DUF455 family protein [Alteripontixanthobacter sp.]